MRMPFGRYRGAALRDVPTDYLEWLSTRDLYGWLAQAVRAELASRRWRHAYGADEEDRGQWRWTPSHHPRHLDPWAVQEIVRVGFRSCVVRYHPDRGGDGETMTRLNLAKEWLDRTIRALAGGRGDD